MAEVTRVWVRTCVLDVTVFGKCKSTNDRSTPGASFDDGDDVDRNWGWARGELVEEANGSSNSNSNSKCVSSKVRVLIKDEDSNHHGNEIDLPGTIAADGDMVMANTYGIGEEEEEDGYGGEDNYYDEYGGGVGAVKEDASDKYPDDLIVLTHLHEPSVVYSLRKRYFYDKIYTATGPILIAINPFKHCTHIYSDQVMQKYYNRGEAIATSPNTSSTSTSTSTSNDSQNPDQQYLPPHVYQIADHSFRTMLSKFNEFTNAQTASKPGSSSTSNGRRRPNSAASTRGYNQSILVSGESGAGKTVTTKFIMKYLATLSKRSTAKANVSDNANNTNKPKRRTRAKPTSTSTATTTTTSDTDKVDIEQQVLQSNPILESFGNARTIRNDNSSRFGKFIEIQFTTRGTLIGASVETYLLEKVRLVTQAAGERNYHIFYELLQGMEDHDLERYHLTEYTAEDFKMTNQSGTFDRRDGVTDYDTYQDLILAMDTMGLTTQERRDTMSIPCALLHASNITFDTITADECQIDRSNPHLTHVLSLLGVSADDLNRALCYFSITAGRETHLRSVSKEKAEKGLLALIKATYGALFTHIVKRVNRSIASQDSSRPARNKTGRSDGGAGAGAATGAYIGVLDIFGFESFKFNSFEQLCINYCNEALQQQFNLFVLKNEQEEYDREGIHWSFISFPDNQDVLDLIDKKGAGILNILDDQCRAPGTTDKTFVNDLYQKLSRHSRFQADFRQVGGKKFAIVHYAGTVEYSSEGFVEKNRDELPKEATDLLLSSSDTFVRHLAQILGGSNEDNGGTTANRGRPAMRPPKKLTVGGQFSRQLHELRQKIDETSPHYVRCLKPNDELVPDHFDPVVIADQLRCAGVIEAVRVSRVGYPQRYTHAMFVSRYRILGIRALKQAARSSRRRKPVEVIVQTIAERIAAEDGTVPVDTGAPTKKGAKGTEVQVDLVAVGIQVGKTKVFLRRKAYEVIEGLRNREMRGAAVKIQSVGRTYVVQMDYLESQTAVLLLQNRARIVFAKTIVQRMRLHHNATLLQTAYRRFVHNRNYLAVLSVTIWLQTLHRGHAGRRRYQILNRDRKAILLQKVWRSNRQRKRFQQKKTAATVVQRALRCRFAKRLFRRLRARARDVNNIARERDELRSEVQRLRIAYDRDRDQAATAQKHSEDTAAQDRIEDLSREIGELQDEVEQVRAEKESEGIRAKDAVKKTTEVLERLECTKNENEQLTEQNTKAVTLCKKKDQEIMVASKEVQILKEKLKHTSTKNDINLEKEIKSLAKEMTSLLNENTKLKKALTSEQERLQSAANSVAEKDAKISVFQREKSVMEKEIQCGARLRQENLALKGTVDTTRIDLEAATSTCTVTQKEMSSCMQQIEKLRANLDDALAEKDAYRQRSEEAENNVDQAQQESTSLKEDLEQIRCELKSAKVELSRAAPHSGTSSEVAKLRKQNKSLQREAIRLREELQETSSNSTIPNEQLAMKGVLDREIETLRMEKESLEEHVNTLSRRVAIEKKAANAFDVILDAAPTDSYEDQPSSPMFSVGSESYDEQDKEVLVLEEKIMRLKKELDESRKSELAKGTDMLNEVDSLRKALADSKNKSIEEILTLQDEVQYLNDELRNVKEGNASNPMGGQRNAQQDNQVGKLIESNLVKDEEIRDLRHEIAMLKGQLHSVPQSIISDYPSMGQTTHDDDRSVVSRLFGQPTASVYTRSSPPNQTGNDKDYIAVRKINESLMKEVEELKKKCQEYKQMMQDEKEHSEREIEAFGEALKGVDELRKAAEDMSREITRLKCNPQASSNSECDSNPIQRMEKAKRTIDISALKSTKQNIWGKVTQTFASARPTDSEDNFAAESGHKTKPERRKRRGKRRDRDDVSIFSAFF